MALTLAQLLSPSTYKTALDAWLTNQSGLTADVAVDNAYNGLVTGTIPTYNFTTVPTSLNEGNVATFQVATNQTGSLSYTLSGIQLADLDGAPSLNGSALIVNGVATITVDTALDALIETETLTVTLNNVTPAVSVAVIITDTTVVGGTTVLTPGTVAPVAATPAADNFSFDVAAAKALTANTQINITGFAVAADKLTIDTTTASAVTTLAGLNGIDGIAVQANVITNETLINFGADANGDVITLTLSGIVDPALVNISVI